MHSRNPNIFSKYRNNTTLLFKMSEKTGEIKIVYGTFRRLAYG